MSNEAPKEGVSKPDEIAAVAAASNDGLGSMEDDDGDIPMTFPQRLMQVVSDESNSDTIAWLPHGKGFIIYKKKKFAAEVLPKAFKQSKYTSFTRKLNRWGFTRVTRGPETGAYYHKFFQRGDTRLCMQMSCQSSRSNPKNLQGVGGGYPSDMQNQQLIRQQLQQLQMHQFHLQQMQQMQAAEMFRQQQAQQQANNAKSSGEGDEEKDSKDAAKPSGDKPAEDTAAPAPQVMPMAADNPYLQSLQQAGVAPQMGFLPVLQPGVFPGGMPPPPGAMGMPGIPGVMPQQQQAAPVAAAAAEESKGEDADETAAAAADSSTAV